MGFTSGVYATTCRPDVPYYRNDVHWLACSYCKRYQKLTDANSCKGCGAGLVEEPKWQKKTYAPVR